MSAEDLEKYETEMELQLYREYRDIVRLFSYVVETERRFYLANRSTCSAHLRRRGLLRGRDARRLGVGHVPAGAVREERPGDDVQGRQRRGAGEARHRAAQGLGLLGGFVDDAQLATQTRFWVPRRSP